MSYFPAQWNNTTFNPYFTPAFAYNPYFNGYNGFVNNFGPNATPFNGYNWNTFNGFNGFNFNNGFNTNPYAFNQPPFGFNWWNNEQTATPYGPGVPQNFSPYTNGYNTPFNGAQAA